MKNKKPPHNKGGSNQDDSDVGYGSPPRSSRFKAGTSGNPKGRPKWQQDQILTRLLGQEIYRPVRVQQAGGGTTTMPAIQIGVRRLMVSAAKGDAAAVTTSIKLAQFLGQAVAEEHSKNPPMSQEERVRRVLELLATAELRQKRKEAKKPPDNSQE